MHNIGGRNRTHNALNDGLLRGKLAIRAGNEDEIINEAVQKKPSAVSGTSFVWPTHSRSTNPIFCLFTGKPGHASKPTTKQCAQSKLRLKNLGTRQNVS